MTRPKLTTADVQGRDVLHRNTSYIVSTMLAEFNAATERKDTRTIIEIAGILLPYTMPKLQAVAHITPNQAIETMEGLREYLIAREAKALPPAVEGEFREVPANTPIPAQDKQGVALSDEVCPIPLPPTTDKPKTVQPGGKPLVIPDGQQSITVQTPWVDSREGGPPKSSGNWKIVEASPNSSKPFSEMTPAEIMARYHPRGGKE